VECSCLCMCCFTDLSFGVPFVNVYHNIWREQSSAHHEVAGCCGVCWCGTLCSSLSSQKHWVNWGCVSLNQWNILYKSARVHTFVTMAWFRFLHNLPLPRSHYLFLTQNTAAVHNVFTCITWCKPSHFLLHWLTRLSFIHGCEMWLRAKVFPPFCTVVYVKFTSERDDKTI
jgi:hypothetical protein